MLDNRTEMYSRKLAELVRHETISYENQYNKEQFYSFRELLKNSFRICLEAVSRKISREAFSCDEKGAVPRPPATGPILPSREPLRMENFGEAEHRTPNADSGQCSMASFGFVRA